MSTDQSAGTADTCNGDVGRPGGDAAGTAGIRPSNAFRPSRKARHTEHPVRRRVRPIRLNRRVPKPPRREWRLRPFRAKHQCAKPFE